MIFCPNFGLLYRGVYTRAILTKQKHRELILDATFALWGG